MAEIVDMAGAIAVIKQAIEDNEEAQEAWAFINDFLEGVQEDMELAKNEIGGASEAIGEIVREG